MAKLCPLKNSKYGSSHDCNEIFCMFWDEGEENCLISSALQKYIKGYTNKEQKELQEQIKMATLDFRTFPYGNVLMRTEKEE